MFLALRLISKKYFIDVIALLALIAVTSSMTGCATASDQLAARLKVGEPVERDYPAKYSDMETAIKQAMIKYPQRVDNTEAGIFETDYVKGDARFRPPYSNIEYSAGYRYRILIRLVSGKSDGRPVVKVLVTKKIERAHDFFADPDAVASDGLEEKSILYRIGRELAIAHAMNR